MANNNCKLSYSALADCYEYLLSYCDYPKWSQYLLKCLKEFDAKKSGLDIACGSGYFTRAIKKAGYKVVGVDISEEMLSEAKERSLKENLDITFLKQDVTSLKSFEKYDFVTCINDGINYVPKEKLKKVFTNVHKVLNKNGLFLFDFSSEYKLKQVIANNMFGEDDEDVSYLWFNTLLDDSVKMELTFFKRKGDVYIRQEETHVQYVHKTEDVEKLLSECGFTVKRKCGLYDEELTLETQRIVFIATKN